MLTEEFLCLLSAVEGVSALSPLVIQSAAKNVFWLRPVNVPGVRLINVAVLVWFVVKVAIVPNPVVIKTAVGSVPKILRVNAGRRLIVAVEAFPEWSLPQLLPQLQYSRLLPRQQ